MRGLILHSLVLSVAGAISPAILVPGDGGSQIDMRWHKGSVPHLYCAKDQDDWFTMWLSVTELLPGAIDCWADSFRLEFDASTGTFSNAPGVEARTPGFGGTETIEYLDPSLQSASKYMFNLAEALSSFGLKRGTSIRGAPYDHRYAVRSQGAWLSNMTALVESTFAANGNTPVTLIGHSMGCLYSLYFLNNQSPEWKTKHVHAFIPISGPWTGTALQLRLFASGDASLVPGGLIKPLSIRGEQRTCESNAWLMPAVGSGDYYWQTDEVVVRTPGHNYTMAELPALFEAFGWPQGTQMRAVVNDLIAELKDPEVATHCLYGTGLPTEETYTYDKDNSWDTQPSHTSGDGDGTVNARSLAACEQWASATVKTYAGVSHSGMLSNSSVFAYIKDVLSSV